MITELYCGNETCRREIPNNGSVLYNPDLRTVYDTLDCSSISHARALRNPRTRDASGITQIITIEEARRIANKYGLEVSATFRVRESTSK